jgi:hypothetical protein
VSVSESDGVRCIAGVSKERAEIALKVEVLFPFETLATEPNSTGCQHRKHAYVTIDEILSGLF